MLEQVEHTLEWILQNIASLAILLFEFIGVGIIIWSGLKGIIKWLRPFRGYEDLSCQGTCHGAGI